MVYSIGQFLDVALARTALLGYPTKETADGRPATIGAGLVTRLGCGIALDLFAAAFVTSARHLGSLPRRDTVLDCLVSMCSVLLSQLVKGPVWL